MYVACRGLNTYIPRILYSCMGALGTLLPKAEIKSLLAALSLLFPENAEHFTRLRGANRRWGVSARASHRFERCTVIWVCGSGYVISALDAARAS